jgi:hypothetical protein
VTRICACAVQTRNDKSMAKLALLVEITPLNDLTRVTWRVKFAQIFARVFNTDFTAPSLQT